MERKRSDIRVKHPEHGEFVAKDVTCNLDAVRAAARRWKLQWSKIARECSFEREEDYHAEGTDAVQL